VQRVKTDYRAHAGQGDSMPMRYTVSGKGLGEMDAELGWLREAQVSESLAVEAQGAPLRMALDYSARLQFAAHAMLRGDQLPSPGWEDEWAAVEGALDTAAIAANSERELDELELGEASFATLLDTILTLARAVPLDHAALTKVS